MTKEDVCSVGFLSAWDAVCKKMLHYLEGSYKQLPGEMTSTGLSDRLPNFVMINYGI